MQPVDPGHRSSSGEAHLLPQPSSAPPLLEPCAEATASHSLCRPNTAKRVILNMTAQAETTPMIFHSLNCDMAFEHDRSIQALSIRNNNLASEAFAGFEWLAGDAIEPFAAQILRDALRRWSSVLPGQTHWPMQCDPLALAAFTRAWCITTSLSRCAHRKNRSSVLPKLESQDPFARNIPIRNLRWTKFPTSRRFQRQLGKISTRSRRIELCSCHVT